MHVDYHMPERLDDALALLAGGGVKMVAGGTDFYPSMRPGGPRESLLDVTRIEGLRGIAHDGDGWRIGAATRWSEIVGADLPAAFDGLKAAAREVGSLQIQNSGTVAGNLCNASPAADGVPALLTLGAEVEVASLEARRSLPLSEFITGVRQTALNAGEMVTGLRIPAQPEGAGGHFSKLGSRSYLVISIAMVAAILRRDTQGRFDVARIAVGACSPVALRLHALEKALIGTAPGEVAVVPGHLAALNPIDDVRGSAGYRLEAVAELIGRLLKGAAHG